MHMPFTTLLSFSHGADLEGKTLSLMPSVCSHPDVDMLKVEIWGI